MPSFMEAEYIFRSVAQLVESRSPKPVVAGSSPAWPVNLQKTRMKMKKIFQFFKECAGELRKVTWPTRSDVLSSTKVVFISTIIVALILGLLDWLFTEGLRLVF